MSWVCASDCLYSNAEKAHTWFPVEDLVLSMSVCNVSLSVYCTWFCPCYTSLSLVPECVLHVILPLLYVPVTCPWVCTARDFVPAIRPCHLSLSVYCTWFCPCFTFLFTCPRVCTARDFAPAIRPCCLSLCMYCTWFCPCYTFLLPVPVCVPHEILLLTRIALTCPCNTSPRFSLSPRNPYDITYRFFGPF